MPIVKYQNHNGETAVLHGDGVSYMNLNELRSYKWDYSTSNRPNGMGGSVLAFAHKPLSKRIRVSTVANSVTDLHDIKNGFHAVAEPDIISREEGKLFVGDQYISCFIVGVTVVEYIILSSLAIVDIDILVTKPFWCTETTTVFNIDTSRQTDLVAKRFPYRFPYRYTTGYANMKLNNTHYTECPMIITIYGPAQNPSIQIAGNTYNVAVQIATESRLVIDQTRHTIEIVNSIGQRTSVFNQRNKQYDVFKPLPAGDNQVQHSGEFKFAITVVQQRSGLKWTK